jgi:hypothetical protein
MSERRDGGVLVRLVRGPSSLSGYTAAENICRDGSLTGGKPVARCLAACQPGSRILTVAARDWRTLAEQEGGPQMRTITDFLLPARTSCTRSLRHVQFSVPPRQAAV